MRCIRNPCRRGDSGRRYLRCLDSLLDGSCPALRLGVEKDGGGEMKVGELIKILQQFNPERRVVVDVWYGFSEPSVKKVSDDHFLNGLATQEEQDFILISKAR